MLFICLTSAYIKTESGKKELDYLLNDIGTTGSDESITRLYHLTHHSVFTFALSILKNHHDAEDVLQECFITIHNSASSYKSQGNPMAWMLTLTKNLCLMKLRKRGKEDEAPEGWEDFIPANESLSHEDKMVLEACLNLLTDEERQIVVLHAVSEMKHKNIASLLGMPLSTVLSKYARAIKKLRKAMEN